MQSYSRGPEVPLLDRTTGEQLEYLANRWPDQLALVSRHQNRRMSWAQMLRTADCVGSGLNAIGIGRGDRVGMWATNCWEWVAVHFACARIGAVLVSVNPASRVRELSFVLRKSGM